MNFWSFSFVSFWRFSPVFLWLKSPVTNKKENAAFYSVNQIGAGMNTTVARAANIRKVIPYGTAPIFFNELLETMNVTFVRNGQLTILPFPFKYLREYIDIKMTK